MKMIFKLVPSKNRKSKNSSDDRRFLLDESAFEVSFVLGELGEYERMTKLYDSFLYRANSEYINKILGTQSKLGIPSGVHRMWRETVKVIDKVMNESNRKGIKLLMSAEKKKEVHIGVFNGDPNLFIASKNPSLEESTMNCIFNCVCLLFDESARNERHTYSDIFNNNLDSIHTVIPEKSINYDGYNPNTWDIANMTSTAEFRVLDIGGNEVGSGLVDVKKNNVSLSSDELRKYEIKLTKTVDEREPATSVYESYNEILDKMIPVVTTLSKKEFKMCMIY